MAVQRRFARAATVGLALVGLISGSAYAAVAVPHNAHPIARAAAAVNSAGLSFTMPVETTSHRRLVLLVEAAGNNCQKNSDTQTGVGVDLSSVKSAPLREEHDWDLPLPCHSATYNAKTGVLSLHPKPSQLAPFGSVKLTLRPTSRKKICGGYQEAGNVMGSLVFNTGSKEWGSVRLTKLKHHATAEAGNFDNCPPERLPSQPCPSSIIYQVQAGDVEAGGSLYGLSGPGKPEYSGQRRVLFKKPSGASRFDYVRAPIKATYKVTENGDDRTVHLVEGSGADERTATLTATQEPVSNVLRCGKGGKQSYTDTSWDAEYTEGAPGLYFDSSVGGGFVVSFESGQSPSGLIDEYSPGGQPF